MLISANRVQLQGNADRCTHSISGNSYTIYWRGFVYLDGVLAGRQSMENFADALAIGEIAQQSSRLKGVYFVLVHDHRSGDCYAFVDGSGLFHAFYSDRFVGTSFLELIEAEQLRFADVDPEAMVEFFHFGNVYCGQTLFSRIRKISPEHVVRLPRNGSSSLLPRPVRDIAASPAPSFEKSIESFAAAAADQRISVDLTGGIDSRLLAVMLHALGMRFEVATCGQKSDPDVVIAERVAEALGLELRVTQRAMQNLDWHEVFRDCDGLFDVLRACSQAQMRKERLRRGISLVVSGLGGELLKDFWWLQDMPFYARSKPDLDRLYALRIAPAALQHSYLCEPYRTMSLTYRDRALAGLSEYAVPGNTWTYDRIYYFYKMREYGGRSITNNLRDVACCAPLLERDVVACGYQLSRRQRFFNGFHRRTITRLNPKVARIPTTEGGITVSSEPAAACGDLVRYACDKLSRLTNKIEQRFFNRSHRQGNFDAADIAAGVRDIVSQRRTLDRLKEARVLDINLSIEQIGTDYLGRMLSLEMLVDKLESTRSATSSNTVAIEVA